MVEKYLHFFMLFFNVNLVFITCHAYIINFYICVLKVAKFLVTCTIGNVSDYMLVYYYMQGSQVVMRQQLISFRTWSTSDISIGAFAAELLLTPDTCSPLHIAPTSKISNQLQFAKHSLNKFYALRIISVQWQIHIITFWLHLIALISNMHVSTFDI